MHATPVQNWSWCSVADALRNILCQNMGPFLSSTTNDLEIHEQFWNSIKGKYGSLVVEYNC